MRIRIVAVLLPLIMPALFFLIWELAGAIQNAIGLPPAGQVADLLDFSLQLLEEKKYAWKYLEC